MLFILDPCHALSPSGEVRVDFTSWLIAQAAVNGRRLATAGVQQVAKAVPNATPPATIQTSMALSPLHDQLGIVPVGHSSESGLMLMSSPKLISFQIRMVPTYIMLQTHSQLTISLTLLSCSIFEACYCLPDCIDLFLFCILIRALAVLERRSASGSVIPGLLSLSPGSR